MKKKKKFVILMVLALLVSMFSFTTPVNAAGSVTVGFSGNSTVTLNNSITIQLNVSNINTPNGGVESLEGNLVFDSEYLELVSSKGTNDPYRFQMNADNNYKIAGLDTYLDSGITSNTSVFTFTFKAKKVGSTQVTINNLKVTDASDRLTANLTPKTITITDGSSSTPKSNDATLKSLGVTGYTLSPNFSPSTTSYTVNVPSGTSSVTLTGAANHNKATVTGLETVTLTGDTTNATVKVTAEDGTIKNYTVRIVREGGQTPSKSNDATLKNLVATGYTLSPSFSAGTTNYTVKVPSGASIVRLEGSTNHNKATVSGLGNITLTGDITVATIKVTAEDGTIKNYTVNIIKEEVITSNKDSDATLKSLDVSGYTLTPIFKKNVNTYSMNVQNSVTGLKVNAIPNSDKAKVEVLNTNGWKEGINVVTIKVTAEDGTLNTYMVNVNREGSKPTNNTKSSDNLLKSLTINSSHKMEPNFNKDIATYNITVPYLVDELDLSYIVNNAKATVKVSGNSDFKVGEVNIVTLEVTAEDGSQRVYILNVTRSVNDSNNDLADIKVKEGELSPKFSSDTLEYTVNVPAGTNKLTIEAKTMSNDSKVEIIGNENLKEGHNTVLIKVTDKDGFSKYYTIDAVKAKDLGTISGLSLIQWGLIGSILSLLVLLILIIILLFRRKKDDNQQPIIEVKPEFNFGSKNKSDDDTVYGNMNQDSDFISDEIPYHGDNFKTIEDRYEEIEDMMPNDPYDETVTKREIIDAIKEAGKTKDPSKLKMLLKQDELNQKKKALKMQEEELQKIKRSRRKKSVEDDWR